MEMATFTWDRVSTRANIAWCLLNQRLPFQVSIRAGFGTGTGAHHLARISLLRLRWVRANSYSAIWCACVAATPVEPWAFKILRARGSGPPQNRAGRLCRLCWNR